MTISTLRSVLPVPGPDCALYYPEKGGKHPDRDAQFRHIANQVAQYQSSGDPVISVDTKKKELIGDFNNGGQEWQPRGQPEEVRVDDFIDPELGKVAPYP